jgi:plastocyanin
VSRIPAKFVAILVFIVVAASGAGFMGVRALSARATATDTCKRITCVELTAMGAVPDTIAVQKGSYVQFNSGDGLTHSISLGKGGEEHDHSGPFSSGDFRADEAWKVQFNDPGTYSFHDHYNPKISMLVVVYEQGADHSIKQ